MTSATALVVMGTRPEAIKLCPIVRAMRCDDRFDPIVAVTAQHREMLDQVLELFDVTPKFDLDLCRPGQGLHDIAAEALRGLSRVIGQALPDVVVVQGDTTTTFAGALAAFYARIPVVHVEAGLRTTTISTPFPEEANRRLTTQLSDLHLAPTPGARDNLLRDNVPPAQIAVTGNTGIDALHWAIAQKPPWGNPDLDDLDADRRRIIVVTAHRRESWGDSMRNIGTALATLATRDDVRIVLPVHLNPVVRQALLPPLENNANVTWIEPLGYGAMCRLLNRASIVITDSGGLQEEAPSLGKPVLVMRDTTERPEGISAGTTKLVGTDPQRIVNEAARLLDDEDAYRAMAKPTNVYGDGHAVPRCLEAIARRYDKGGVVAC